MTQQTAQQTQPSEREIIAQDTFSTNPHSLQARMEAAGAYGLEYIKDSGERRVYDPGRPISHNEAFQMANEHRQAGEVFLQVVTLHETRNETQETAG